MPARDPNEIRSEIEETRREIAHSIANLRDSVTEATDWKHYVRRQPLATIAAAFAIGFVIGMR
jgi:ElaB/YqjD/DUF883 family membrane-anchored ribosome-binding protein